MRVLFVQAGLDAGGAEKVINLIAHNRLALGDDVHVLAHNETDTDSYYAYAPDVTLHAMPPQEMAGSSYTRSWRKIRWLRRKFADLKPDLVVSFLTKTNVKSLVAVQGLNVPIVISERNNPEMQAGSRFWKHAFYTLGRRADHIVMLTDAGLRALPPALRKMSSVVPNPCVLPVARRPMDKTAGRQIVAVGRLDRQKGFDLLLEAFALAVPRAPQVSLAIFGEGPDRSALEARIATLGLSGKVTLRGRSAQPHDWLDTAEIFVLSSRHEGFGNVLVEALASGIPSIAFDCPWGPREILSPPESGRLVENGNVAALADAIVELSSDADLRARLSKGAISASERYRHDHVLALWDRYIDAVSARQPVS